MTTAGLHWEYAMMPFRTALKLGRVSNLPTVWTNVLAGLALSALEPPWRLVAPLGVAVSLLYVSGMYLNDAFDARWDAANRAERPIPAGEVSARTVFRVGFAMMAAALVILAVATNSAALVAGLVLAGLILVYDVSHKGNPLAPFVMGLCRVAVYGVAANAAGNPLTPPLLAGAFFLFFYLVLLTLIARQETKDPKIPRLVGRLIAGISLVDGAQVLAMGHPWVALACAGAFVLTLRLQKRVAGT
jgi:4-hydroxybenzoate polyprenyltransferase